MQIPQQFPARLQQGPPLCVYCMPSFFSFQKPSTSLMFLVQCVNGFVLQGDHCVCPHPRRVCQGNCTWSACPSAVPRPSKTGRPSGVPHLSGVTHPSKRNVEEQFRFRSLCPAGKEPCGGFMGPDSYECIDITTTLDSCEYFNSFWNA
jgi:hypothetical protein